ncbi:MAG: hypothetical protein IJR08_00130 [Bacilli bacterium]|nr:hypothetical protein [Bacilli bacterium]
MVIKESEIIKRISETPNFKEKRKIVEKYLIDNFVGRTITKEFLDKHLNTKAIAIKETGGDIKELTFRRGNDVLKSLTLLDQLIEASEYDTEAASTKEKGKNDYYWYFKVAVRIDSKTFNYKLNIGRNRYDGNIALYSITNYKKTRHGDF